jgi:hypothetical protein
MHSRWARVARGWAVAAFATFVAAFSHALGGGATPSVFGILASLVLSGMFCSLLAGRTLSRWRLSLSVAISQVLFHGLFVSLGTPIPIAASMGDMTGGMPLDAAPLAHHTGASMWLAHVVSGLITLVAFRYAEQAFWGMADTARLALSRLTSLVIPVLATPRASVILPETRELPIRLTHLVHSMSHRGPPVEFA